MSSLTEDDVGLAVLARGLSVLSSKKAKGTCISAVNGIVEEFIDDLIVLNRAALAFDRENAIAMIA